MKPVSVLQWSGLALTALFMGIFLLDWAYFIDHHLLVILAVVMTTLGEAETYLTKNNEGIITPRNAMLTSVLIFLMIAAFYVDYTGSHVFHLIEGR